MSHSWNTDAQRSKSEKDKLQQIKWWASIHASCSPAVWCHLNLLRSAVASSRKHFFSLLLNFIILKQHYKRMNTFYTQRLSSHQHVAVTELTYHNIWFKPLSSHFPLVILLHKPSHMQKKHAPVKGITYNSSFIVSAKSINQTSTYINF